MPNPLFVLLPVPHAWQHLFALLVLTPERLALLALRLERHRQWQRQDASLSLSCFDDSPPLAEVFTSFPALGELVDVTEASQSEEPSLLAGDPRLLPGWSEARLQVEYALTRVAASGLDWESGMAGEVFESIVLDAGLLLTWAARPQMEVRHGPGR